MTVGELIEILENYDEEAIIVVQDGDTYVCEITGEVIEGKAVRAFWGNDFKALVLEQGEQLGAVCDVDAADIDELEDDEDE